ncbi:MAG: hypothetical protein AB7S38_01485 [Vulcanimicrobiota bacterium]
MKISGLRPVITRPRVARAQSGPLDRVELSGGRPLGQVALLGAGQAAALAALPPAAQVAFLHVWPSLAGDPNFLPLLEQGKLGQSDGQATTIEHLEKMAGQRARGLDGHKLMAETVAAIARPESVRQGNRYTCGATNMEAELAAEPASFARVVEGLTNAGGKAALDTGFPLERAAGSEREDGSGRTQLDRVVQGALMGLAGMRHGEYLALEDRFSQAPDQKGLDGIDVALMVAVARGQDQTLVIADQATRETLRQALIQTEVPMQVGANWEGQDHMLLVKPSPSDEVQFFNPQSGPASLPVEDLLDKLQYAVLPADGLGPLPEGLAAPIRLADLMG